ncbi:MAG: DNA polymerase III subunit epsilon [Bacteroidetes bacterium]|nr:MAG: DNA polymerase III subunit epsilon [Bacteroidota bacterium]
MFAIIDVETTGLSAKNEKITEIAILLHDGKKVTEEFHSLINPEKKIPYRITQITGINDRMVANAPKFFELAKKIIEMTEDRIIVGHNVTFDYNFLRSEFREFDYNFERKTLCTVRNSRKYIKGQASYSLGKLTKSLGIPHTDKHRALGDAKATAHLLDILLDIEPELAGGNRFYLPPALNKEIIDKLPHKTGVYYFLNANKEIIYVGKSINIHKRILQHLNNHSTRKSVEMINHIADVKYEITGSELVALLLESDEIKRLKPIYNRAQRRSIFTHGLFSRINAEGYFELYTDKIEELSKPYTSFQSRDAAKEFMFQLTEEYELCQKYTHLFKTDGACFDYQIHKCKGACIGKESSEDYNKRVMMALDRLQFQHQNFYILEKGRQPGERAVVQIKNGIYQGFSFVKDYEIGDKALLSKSIRKMKNNKDTQSIIRSYLNNHSVDLIIF